MKKISAAVLAVLWMLLMTLPVTAADSALENNVPISQIAIEYDFEHQTLEGIITQFREKNGLDESNFSMCYYATGSGEQYRYAGDVFRTAASTIKVPLVMLYYDMIREGTLSMDTELDGYTLSFLLYQTIVYSDNATTQILIDGLGFFAVYREKLTTFYDQNYPDTFYSENIINADYMMAILHQLYDNAEAYAELIDNMKIAADGAYFQLNVTEYEIAHKYGHYEGAVNDIGIIYTPEPFLLVVYTEGVCGNDALLGSIAELMTEYTLYQSELREREAAARTAVLTEEPVESALPDETENMEGNNVILKVLLVLFVVVLIAGAFLAGVIVGARLERRRVQIIRKQRSQHQQK